MESLRALLLGVLQAGNPRHLREGWPGSEAGLWLLHPVPVPRARVDRTIASFLLKEGKPAEEASFATLTGPAVDVITYDEDEEPDTDVDENIDED